VHYETISFGAENGNIPVAQCEFGRELPSGHGRVAYSRMCSSNPKALCVEVLIDFGSGDGFVDDLRSYLTPPCPSHPNGCD
jgi:hypothetical protein